MIGQANLETNLTTIKLKTVSHMAEPSWVPLPFCSLPKYPFPIVSLPSHVSPRTIRFCWTSKSPLLGPGSGPTSFKLNLRVAPRHPYLYSQVFAQKTPPSDLPLFTQPTENVFSTITFHFIGTCHQVTLTHLKRPWCWERLKAGEGDD